MEISMENEQSGVTGVVVRDVDDELIQIAQTNWYGHVSTIEVLWMQKRWLCVMELGLRWRAILRM